jgi:hypothetical protein
LVAIIEFHGGIHRGYRTISSEFFFVKRYTQSHLNSFIGYLLQYFGNFYRELSSSHQSVSQPGKGFSQVRGSRWVIPARGLLKCF